MSSLSVVREGAPARVVAAPIFVVSKDHGSKDRGEIVFEVLEKDADALKALVGAAHLFAFDGVALWGILQPLASCESAHPGLAYLRNQPTLRGTLLTFTDDGKPRQ